MKSTSELTDFYYKTLYPVLEELENTRAALKARILTIGVIYTLIIFFVTLFVLNISFTLDVVIIAVFIYLGGGGLIYKFLIKDYTQEFKQRIIAPLINALDKNLKYSANRHIDPLYFTRSKLFTSDVDRVSGNDFVKGKIDNIDIQFSDFHAEQEHKDSKGNKSWSTIFQGLFIVCEFNKNFHGRTIILPDTAQSTFGDLIGGWFQSNNMSRDELVKMDDIEFEKAFVVYATDQIEARYILSHTLMKRLLDFKKRSGKNIFVSFNSNDITLAIAYNKDLFEPSIFHSLLKYKIAMEYVQTLHLAIGIVEELKLNTKLWSKL